MKRLLFLLTLLLPVLSMSQNLKQAEYFFDSDPGYGNGIKMNFNPSSSIKLSTNIYTGLLDKGFHTFFYRFKDDSLGWGNTYSRHVFINQTQDKLQQAEYFFDEDPGFGKGIKFTFSSADNIVLAANLYTGLIQPGFHTLYYRFKDEDSWGHTFCYNIYKPKKHKIARLIYAFDTDFQKYVKELSQPVYSLNENFSLSMEGLSLGEHTLHLWVQNTDGSLSDTISLKFNQVVDALDEFDVENVEVFPNPASNVVSFTGNILVREVIIYNTNGKKLNQINGDIKYVSVVDLPNGIYIFLIKTDSGIDLKTIAVSH